APFGTQKILAARYSSGSSGSAPWAFCVSSSACLASKASEMYLRKMRPRTTCLYSAASMLLRRASAAAHSFASKPRFAVVRLLVALTMRRRTPRYADWGSERLPACQMPKSGIRILLSTRVSSALAGRHPVYTPASLPVIAALADLTGVVGQPQLIREPSQAGARALALGAVATRAMGGAGDPSSRSLPGINTL